jgi:hypothetical protein
MDNKKQGEITKEALMSVSKRKGRVSLLKPAKKTATRRPPNNSNMPMRKIEQLSYEFNDTKTELENYAAHLRALDRQRLNGVGIKKQGFIERAYELAETNQEYLPHYLTIEKFQEDNEYKGTVCNTPTMM